MKRSGTISNLTEKKETTIHTNGNLSRLCADLLLIVMRMRETDTLGNPVSLRKLIYSFINKFENSCRDCGIDNIQMLDAEYAIVGLIDETILSIEGECRDYWISQPVQLDMFQNNIAGENFYTKLTKLSAEPEKNRDVLEVYYLCMSLGFEGKYRVCKQEERDKIIDDLGRKLRRARARGSNDSSFHITTGNSYSGQKVKIFIPQIRLCAIITTVTVLITYLLLIIDYHSHVLNLLEILKK